LRSSCSCLARLGEALTDEYFGWSYERSQRCHLRAMRGGHGLVDRASISAPVWKRQTSRDARAGACVERGRIMYGRVPPTLRSIAIDRLSPCRSRPVALERREVVLAGVGESGGAA
jgi:hypothetical protein